MGRLKRYLHLMKRQHLNAYAVRRNVNGMKQYLHQLKHIELDSDEVWFDLFRTILIFVVATIFSLLVSEIALIRDNIFGFYMLAVALTSVLTNGYVWGILSSLFGVVAVNFFFTYPYLSLNFSLAGYPVTFALLLWISIMTSTLTARVKKSAKLSLMRELKAESFAQMSNNLLAVNDIDTVLEMTVSHFYQLNGCSVVLYYGSPYAPTIKKQIIINSNDELILESPLELQVANQAYTKNEVTGVAMEKRTQNCRGTYIPLSKANKMYGVLGLLFESQECIFYDTFRFGQIMVSQAVMALERQELEEQTKRITVEKEKENMRSNLLRAVSHDIRTPLTCIMGAATTLKDNEEILAKEEKTELYDTIMKDAEWLIHMVENLLSVTRIHGNEAKVHKQEEVVEEVVAQGIARVQKRYPHAKVEVRVPDEILIAPMDAILIEQVLINLVENAVRHSGSELPIQVFVEHEGERAVFSVRDFGKGLRIASDGDMFDGKNGVQSGDSTRGLGIGLSICKTIVLAHGGDILAENCIGGGACFKFWLPMVGGA